MAPTDAARLEPGRPAAAARMRPWNEPAMLVTAAGLALAVGLLLYQIDRGLWRTTWGAAWTSGLLFGTLGQWLPSMLHTFAFSLLTAAARAPSAGSATVPAYGACAAWWAVNVAFEAGQHPQVSAPLAALLRDTFGHGWLAQRIANYFSYGTFDGGDIVAATVGALAAAAVLWLVHQQGEIRHAR